MASFSFTKNGKPIKPSVQPVSPRVNVGDAVLAGQLAKSIILERTAAGKDVNGSAFAPYSKKGPYYYYPSRRGSLKQRRAAAGRLAKITAETVFFREHYGAGVFSGGKQTRIGIKFNSYADFKGSLGRGNVDLTGPRAPHMLQGLVIKAGGATVTGDSGQENNTQLVNQFELGFYGEEAARARGNNEGTAHVPRRRFFALSPQELQKLMALIGDRIKQRLSKGLG